MLSENVRMIYDSFTNRFYINIMDYDDFFGIKRSCEGGDRCTMTEKIEVIGKSIPGELNCLSSEPLSKNG